MNILQICPFSYNHPGGVSEHVRNISERLARKHDVTVYATHAGSSFQRSAILNKVRIENFRRYAPNDAYLFSWEMLLRILRTKYDVVHAHCYHAFPFHFSTLAKCQKLILTTHFHGSGHSPFRDALIRLLKSFGKRTLRKADKIIAVSDYEKALLSEEFTFSRSKTKVIPNGLDLGSFSGLKRNHAKDFRSILYVGFLFPYKGAQYLVDILPKLSDDVILELVGKGPLKDYLERRATKLMVQDRVKFHGYLPRKELLQKYVDSDVFILLSKYESYSIVVAEALAAGTPCIVANTSALQEWIDNESCYGINIPVNLDRLAKLVNKVVHERTRASNASGKWVGKKILDWNEVTEQLENVYVE